MSTTLASVDPVNRNLSGPNTHRQEIQNWVRRFGLRQAAILLVQGLAIAILCLIACSSLIVLLDTLRWIDDPTRYVLSLTMYGLSIGAGLWYGIARWW